MRPKVSFALALFTCACSAARPRDSVLDTYPHDVIGHTDVAYYDVHGRTVAELYADMRRQGPKVADTGFVAETRSPMRWTWRTQVEGSSSCSFHDVRVYVNAQIVLPRWTPPADTEPGVFAEWNRFIAALETHEAGHKDISAKAGSEIVQKVSALSGLCSMIGQRASDIARGIVDRANEQQRAYDAETRHGLTQGTSFGMRRATASPVDASGAFIFPKNGATLVPRQGATLASLAISVDSAFRAIPAAFVAAGLTVTASDSTSRTVAYVGAVRDRIGDSPLSAYFDCMGAPSGEMSLAAAAQAISDLSGGTRVIVVTYASVRGAAGATTVCRSTGGLERRIIQMIRTR